MQPPSTNPSNPTSTTRTRTSEARTLIAITIVVLATPLPKIAALGSLGEPHDDIRA